MFGKIRSFSHVHKTHKINVYEFPNFEKITKVTFGILAISMNAHLNQHKQKCYMKTTDHSLHCHCQAEC